MSITKRRQRVIQIIPQPTFACDGVGDYAVALGRALVEAGYLIHYHCPNKKQTDTTDSTCYAGALSSTLQDLDGNAPSSVIIAHYVGYGYARRGCPFGLVRELVRWKRTSGGRLITIFHEVYAFGPPWVSSFWLSPLQRLLARRLARASDGIITSLRRYAGLISRLANRSVDLVLPVVSTVGEPESVPLLTERWPRLVVFGSAHHRRRIYRDRSAWLREACSRLEIREIVDVGEEVIDLPHIVGEYPVRRLGRLSPAGVQDVLMSSRACFIGYLPDFLPKSTVYAAACSHGTIPVCAAGTASQEGLEEGRHYWVPRRRLAPMDAQSIADNARSWYLAHDVQTQTQALRRLL